MKKNVAGQKIGCQMISASDGSAFTGSVAVLVTGDAGVQAAGSIGSGACTHEGNGYHTYSPAQAETNYDLIAFTFTGTGAIPTTLQVFTSHPQTGDAFDRIGATGSGLTTITAKTDNLPTDPADASVIAGLIAAVQAVVDAITLKTVNLPDDPADQSLLLAATEVIMSAISALNNLSLPQATAAAVSALGSYNASTETDVNAARDAVITAIGEAETLVTTTGGYLIAKVPELDNNPNKEFIDIIQGESRKLTLVVIPNKGLFELESPESISVKIGDTKGNVLEFEESSDNSPIERVAEDFNIQVFRVQLSSVDTAELEAGLARVEVLIDSQKVLLTHTIRILKSL